MSKYWKLAYFSAIADHSDEAFECVLSVSRKNNRAAGISGLLMRDKSSYFQYLEGEREAIGASMLRIAGDARHNEVTLVMSVPTDVLFLDGWALADAKLPHRKKSLAAFKKLLLNSTRQDRVSLIDTACIEATLK